MSDQIVINVTPNPSILINAIDHQQSIALNPITLNQGLINHGITHISGGSDEVLHNSLRNQGGQAGEYYHLTANQYSGVVYQTGLSIYATQYFVTGISGNLQNQITTLNNKTGSYTLHSETGAFYATSNPSGFITGVNLSAYATTVYVTGVSGVLQGQITTLNNQTGSYTLHSETGAFYPSSNPSGYITGVNLSATGAFLTTGNADARYVSLTSSQTISGAKAFDQRPTVFGTGVMLSGEAAQLPTTLVYTTGDQNISGVKTFLTGINVSGAVSIASPSGSINYAGIQLSGYNGQSLFQSIQNTAASVSGSTDISLYNDTGAYLDLGIASSTYNGNLFSPTFNIVNSGDSYIYSTAKNFVVGTASSGDVVFFTSGTLSGNERMRITAGGNVGIGTGTPNSALTVVGNVSATGGFTFGTYNTVGYYGMKYDPTSGGAGKLTLSRSAGAGDIMITLDPASNAITAGTVRANTLQNSSVTTIISLGDSANTVNQRNDLNPQAFNIYNTYVSATGHERLSLGWTGNTGRIGTDQGTGSGSARDLQFMTSGVGRMTILSGGNVGIGTSTPSSTAILELSSTGRGFLPPRLTTTQRNVIASPADGLVIYNSTQTNLNTYNSGISGWEAVVDSDYVQNVSTLTQAQYNALSGGPVATTLYIITDAPSAGTSIANIASKTGNYTITSSDYCINVTASINTTITLPSAIGLAGYIFVIKNSGTGIVTVVPASGELIDGSSSMVIGTRYNSMTVMSLGTSTGYIIT